MKGGKGTRSPNLEVFLFCVLEDSIVELVTLSAEYSAAFVTRSSRRTDDLSLLKTAVRFLSLVHPPSARLLDCEHAHLNGCGDPLRLSKQRLAAYVAPPDPQLSPLWRRCSSASSNIDSADEGQQQQQQRHAVIASVDVATWRSYSLRCAGRSRDRCAGGRLERRCRPRDGVRVADSETRRRRPRMANWRSDPVRFRPGESSAR